MTLDWTDIASCKELRELYMKRGMSIETLAAHLGVGYETLRQRLHKCGVKLKSRGGTRYQFPRELLPDNAADMATAQLVKLTGFSASHCRKIRRELREERNGQTRHTKA